MERKFFEDNELVHAVINSDYDKVKKLIETKYTKPVYDIGGFEKQCPIFIISKCLDMCFSYSPDTQIFKERAEKNKEILNLFYYQYFLGNTEDLMIEDYTGPYFNNEEGRVMEWKEESVHFDFSKNLEELLHDELSDKKRYWVIKQLCELGANPYDESFDDQELIYYTGDDMQISASLIESILQKNKDKYTIEDVVEIISFGRDMQNFVIMQKYAN